MGRMIKVALFLFFLSLSVSQNSAIASVDQYLCEYGMRLFREGNIDEAVHSLKKALLANPNNAEAREQLKKILGYLESQEEPQPQDTQQEELIAQLTSQITELSMQKMKYQELVQKKEGELRFNVGKEEGKIGQLKSEVERLQREREVDAARVAALQNEKCKTLQLSGQISQLADEKQQRIAEIGQKEKALTDLKLSYEQEVKDLRSLIHSQEEKINALSLDKRALFEENIKIERQQLVELERLITMIEAGDGLSLLD